MTIKELNDLGAKYLNEPSFGDNWDFNGAALWLDKHLADDINLERRLLQTVNDIRNAIDIDKALYDLNIEQSFISADKASMWSDEDIESLERYLSRSDISEKNKLIAKADLQQAHEQIKYTIAGAKENNDILKVEWAKCISNTPLMKVTKASDSDIIKAILLTAKGIEKSPKRDKIIDMF